jgi:deoxyribonuclease-4
MPLLIGPNLDISNSLSEVISTMPYSVCQVTLGRKKISLADRQATSLVCQEEQKRVYVHTCLSVNLGKIDAESSLVSIKSDLSIFRAGTPGAGVLHVGKACDHVPKGTKRPNSEQVEITRNLVIARLNSLENLLRTQQDPMLLLENAAGQGTEIGTNWEDLRKISEGLDHRYVGLCVDTQHAFGSGLVEWKSPEEVDKVFDFISEIGLPLGLVHLNDSAVTFSSQVDRHACLGTGYIWEKSQESLWYLLDRCEEEGKPVILETPDQIRDLAWIGQERKKLCLP